MDIVAAGTLIGGKYIVTEQIGSGGMGHVYHARHLAIPEFEVAIKILDPAFTTTVENKDRFRNEVIAGYRASHPNIVQMYEYFDLGTMQAFAMEYVNGGSLFEAMSEGALPFDISLSFIKQIAMGLSAFHRAGTHHRDLKPANVLLTDEGVAKLTDFGIARVRGGFRFDDDGLLAGTPKYASPEYLENGESDHRGDIYALGVLAYEMFSGASPFKSETVQSLTQERQESPVTQLHLLHPAIPCEISELVVRCMAQEPIQRFPHASDIVDVARDIQRKYGYGEAECVERKVKTTRIVWRSFLDHELSELQSSRQGSEEVHLG